MVLELSQRWRDGIFRLLRDSERSAVLREAAIGGQLRTWTAALTDVVVEAFIAEGLQAAAKGHRLTVLPVSRNEYLSMDVMAFPNGEIDWQFPLAVVELENSGDDDQVAYSLWKVLCIRANLRAVFCYRKTEDAAAALVRRLRDDVIGSMKIDFRLALEGETFVVVGTRGEAGTFPYGFFKWWRLDRNTGTFSVA
jgi:hypothetical protein